MGIATKNKFRLILLTFTLSFAGIVLSLYFLRGIAVKVKESKVKVAEINRDISLLDKISTENKQYENDIQKIKSTLPNEYYQVSFFSSEIERLAGNNSLSLEINIEKEKKEETETLNSIEFSLAIDGSYTSLTNFLTQISQLPYHTSLEHMEFSRKADEPAAKIRLKLFVQ